MLTPAGLGAGRSTSITMTVPSSIRSSAACIRSAAASPTCDAISTPAKLITLPMPTEPVGTGAMWMIASREGIFGLDLVTYRLVKVEQLSAESATLSVATKRYATSNRFDFEGLPADAPHDLAEFEAKTDGKLVLKPGSPLPVSGDLESRLAAQLLMPGPQQQRGVIQIQSRVALDFGKH